MENQKDLLGLAKKNFDEVKAILGNEKASAEDKGRVEGLLKDAKDFQAKAAQLRDIADFGRQLVADAEKDQGDEKDKGPEKTAQKFANWGEFLYKAWEVAAEPHKGVDPRLQKFREQVIAGHDKKDMSEQTGAAGGFLVPAEFNETMMSVAAESSLVRSRATIIRMRRREISLPVLSQVGTTAGVPHWFGGMQFYWEEEGAEKTETDPEFRKVNLVAHKLIGYTRASDELVDDSAISLSDFLAGPMGMAGGIAWMEDFAFLRGSGAGQPLGILNSAATISVPRQQSNIAVGYEDLVNMIANFLPGSKGVWIASQSLMASLLTMNGPTGNPSYLWGSAQTGVPNTLLGFPIVWSEKSPVAGQAGDIALADFRYYLIGDRQATTVETTKFDRWRFDQTSWRAVHRVDGQPWLSAPLTYQDGTTQVSPFVMLGLETT